MDEKIETHESFGLISFHRQTAGGSGENLFGSSIKHHNIIRMEVSRGERQRNLNQDWYHGRELLLSVDMSPTQFAEAITTMNFGSGIPCTIRYVDKKRMEEPPKNEVRQEFENEFNKDMKKVAKLSGMALAKAKEIRAKKSISKSDMEDLISNLYHMNMELESNIPFVRDQFNKQVDKTVAEAKGEIDAAITHAIQATGLKALKEQAPILRIEEHSRDEASGIIQGEKS